MMLSPNPAQQEISMRADSGRRDRDPMSRASVAQTPPLAAGLTSRDFALVGLAVAFLAVVALLYLVQAAETTRIAYRVHELRVTAARLEQENSVLQFEIAQREQLQEIERRAEQLGFATPKQIHYVRGDQVAAGAGASGASGASAASER